MSALLQIGHASHVGLERQINEDSYLVLVPPGVAPPVDALLIVADGVGGANAGEVASGLLLESFLGWFQNNRYAEHVHYNAGHPDYFIAALKDLLENVNERLYQTAATRPEWANMGTTATVALLSGNRLFLGHVGDTRAYLLRGSGIQQLTTDHSWVAEEVAAGRLTEAQAQNHPRRNAINRVLGNTPLLRVERKAYDVQPHDIFVLTSDGLTGLVSDAEIRAIVMGNRAPQDACNQLIVLANQRGGHDNISVLAARVLPEGAKATGVGAEGAAISSVYLGQGATAPNEARREPRLAPGYTVVAQRPPRAPRAANSGRWGILLLLFVTLATTAAALALAAYVTVRDDLPLNVAGQQLGSAVVVGSLVVVSVVIGFLLGYFGRQWLVEHHQARERESNS